MLLYSSTVSHMFKQLVNKSGYRELGEFLKERGLSYEDYLCSSHWKNVVRTFKKNECEICSNTKNLHLHHMSYKNIGKEKKEDLCTLCKHCHLAAHTMYYKNTLKKITKPSNALANIINRIRNKTESKVHIKKLALFLRKSYLSRGSINTDIKFYKHLASQLTRLTKEK